MNHQPLLLDTGIVMGLLKENPLGEGVRESLRLTLQPMRPLMAIVSVGECLKIARHCNWGEPRVEGLRQLITSLTVVRLTPQVITEYVEMACWLRRFGRTMQHNDLWIAAAARAAGARVITTDGDFDCLAPGFIERTRFHPRSGELVAN